MGKTRNPGFVEVWRLWRHCCCRYGLFPLLVAALVTVACLCDIYSSMGCDFIRMDIGFVPLNGVWSEFDSQAQIGVFNFDSHETDRNKWKRRFNDGCQAYSNNFVNTFIATDQSWYISRMISYVSGLSSLVALATAWLLTITPLPASFFWPGVLLPSVVLAMLAGAAKFIFFDTHICTENLWYVDESSPPVAAQSCEMGESSMFGIAGVAGYFLCTALICWRSPQRRVLLHFDEQGSSITHHSGTDSNCNDPELGENEVNNTAVALSGREPALGISNHETTGTRESKRTTKFKNTKNTDISKNVYYTRCAPYDGERRSSKVLPEDKPQDYSATKWNNYGRPIVVTIDDSDHEGRTRSRSGGSSSITQSRKKSTRSRNMPPLHTGASTRQPNANNESSNCSVGSRMSKFSLLSFPNTQASDDVSDAEMQSSISSSTKNAPSVVAIPRHSRKVSSSGFAHSSGGKKARHQTMPKEERNNIFLNDPQCQMPGSGSRLDAKRDMIEHLPRLDEMSTTRSLEDHGDLINQCVRNLQNSFNDSGFPTI